MTTTEMDIDCEWYILNAKEGNFTVSDDVNGTLCGQLLTTFFTETPTTLEQNDAETQADAFSIHEEVETTPVSTFLAKLSVELAPGNQTTQAHLDTEVSTKPFLFDLNEATTTTEGDIMENVIKNITLLAKPDVMRVNNSLCEWYLPTIHQTPHALGNAGIALWVLGFVITFILMILFAKQSYFIYKSSHKTFRRHLYSITSIYVVMASLTSLGSGIPRAHAVCSGMKDVYMSIGIGHFVDLTISMYGGENVMAWYLKDKIINIRVIPVCKCFCCIPRCKVKRISVAVLKWLVWQMKWSQAVYYLMKLIWIKSLENSLGVVYRENSSFWYMHILNVMSFLSGVFSLIIIGSLVRDDLEEKYKYTIKTKLVRFTILTTKLQRLLFEVLEAFNVFPCYPPYVSQKFYKNVLKDFIYLIEVLILGTITFFVYMKRGEFENGNSKEVPQPMLERTEEIPEENGGFPITDDAVIVALKLNDSPESNC